MLIIACDGGNGQKTMESMEAGLRVLANFLEMNAQAVKARNEAERQAKTGMRNNPLIILASLGRVREINANDTNTESGSVLTAEKPVIDVVRRWAFRYR